MEVRGTFSAPARARASEGQPTGRQGLNRPFSAQGRVDQEQTLRKPPPQGQRRLRPRGLHRTHNDAAAELSAPSRSRSEQRTWLKTTGSRPVASASCGRNSARIGGESGQPTSSVPPISTQSSLLSAAKSFSTTGYPPHPCRLVPRHETLALKGLRGLQLLPKFSFFWKGGEEIGLIPLLTVCTRSRSARKRSISRQSISGKTGFVSHARAGLVGKVLAGISRRSRRPPWCIQATSLSSSLSRLSGHGSNLTFFG